MYHSAISAAMTRICRRNLIVNNMYNLLTHLDFLRNTLAAADGHSLIRPSEQKDYLVCAVFVSA